MKGYKYTENGILTFSPTKPQSLPYEEFIIEDSSIPIQEDLTKVYDDVILLSYIPVFDNNYSAKEVLPYGAIYQTPAGDLRIVSNYIDTINTLSVSEMRIQPATAGGPTQHDATLVVGQAPCVLYFAVFGGAGAGTTTQAKLQVNGSNLYTSATATQYQTLKDSYTFTSPGTYSISLYGTFVGSSGNNATCRISGAY